jgi:hypothetical protein
MIAFSGVAALITTTSLQHGSPPPFCRVLSCAVLLPLLALAAYEHDPPAQAAAEQPEPVQDLQETQEAPRTQHWTARAETGIKEGLMPFQASQHRGPGG